MKADFGEGFAHYWNSRYSQALPYLKKSAQCEYPLAYLYLGRIYESGLGIPKDELISKGYFQSAGKYGVWFKDQAATGDPESQFHLGRYYELVEKDAKQAVVWYQKAADQGYEYCSVLVGLGAMRLEPV